MVDYLILGSGFRPCIAALMASKSGYSVALVDDQETVCKFIKPGSWNGYALDKGPQYFDNFNKYDWDLMDYLLGKNLFEDLEFKYASFIDGKLNCDFALPVWSDCKDLDFENIFKDLIKINSYKKKDFKNFDDLLKNDGGKYLYPYLSKLCNKLLQIDPKMASDKTSNMVTFIGRKKLFDNEKSLEFKKNKIFDEILAAKKKYIGEKSYNLYSKTGSLEDVRIAIENSLKKNVQLFLGNKIENIDLKSNEISIQNNEKISFKNIMFADSIQRWDTGIQ